MMLPAAFKVPVYAVLDQQLGQRGAHFIAVKILAARAAKAHAAKQAPALAAQAAPAAKAPAGSWLPAFVVGAAVGALAFRLSRKN